MPWLDYEQVIAAARRRQACTVAVAGAADVQVLAAVQAALERGLARPILIGDQEGIVRTAREVGLDLAAVELVPADGPRAAAVTAARLAGDGRAQVLMKGQVSSADFLAALLSPEIGLRRAPLLSHLACLQVPALGRLVWITDGGMVPRPNLEQKLQILANAVSCLQRLGYERPRVAVVAAVETVNPQMPATIDAAALAKAAERGQIAGADVDGPLGLDGALSPDAARRKGLAGSVAGQADLLLVPDIEAGNLLAKAMVYAAGGTMAGLVLGTAAGVVLTSRADPPLARLASLAMAALSAER